MASEQQDRGRKPRNYYVDYSKKGPRNFKDRGRGYTGGNKRFAEISFGLRGFLITSIDEVKSYLEMRNILEGYHEQIYNESKPTDGQQGDTTEKSSNMTTEDELESELKQIRSNRPFKQVNTHCRNSIFITIQKDFEHIDPILMVDKFFDDMEEKREARTRNTYKVLPILDTFRNSPACARESVANLLEKLFKEDTSPHKFFIEFQSRGNYKLDSEAKQKMIEDVADAVSQWRPEWTVSRDSADFMIVLIALRDVCCATILKNYFKRAKYNVTEFCKEPEDQSASSEATKG